MDQPTGVRMADWFSQAALRLARDLKQLQDPLATHACTNVTTV